MDEKIANTIIDKIFKNTLGFNPAPDYATAKERYSGTIDTLPFPVTDLATQKQTWTVVKQASSYIAQTNMQEIDTANGWTPKQPPSTDITQLLSTWQALNSITAERTQDSINVAESDLIYGCENVYQCTNCNGSKNIVLCNDCGNSEYLFASQHSGSCNFCIRADDSVNCSNSYELKYCNKVVDSLFIQDCFDLYECIFCAHLSSKKFCITNVQLDQSTYYDIKNHILKWLGNN